MPNPQGRGSLRAPLESEIHPRIPVPQEPGVGAGDYGEVVHFEFEAEIWRWQARNDDGWLFVRVPEELSAEIR